MSALRGTGVCQGAGVGRDAVHAVLRAEAVARLFADRVLVAFVPLLQQRWALVRRAARAGRRRAGGWADPARSALVHRLAGQRGMRRRGRRRAARRPGRPGVGIVGAPRPETSGRHPATRSCPVAREGDDSRGRCAGVLHQARPRVSCGKPESAACDRARIGRAEPPVAAPLACGRPRLVACWVDTRGPSHVRRRRVVGEPSP